ncbi:MAG TPA: RNA polymerase factor sigma-54 [Pseudomonadales bacterium]
MKQSLQLKIGQQLSMTPQLQQAIRLLQLSTLDLQQEIQAALESNPLLEVSEDGEDTFEPADDDSDAEGSSPLPTSEASPHNESSPTDSDDTDWQPDSLPNDLPVDTDWDNFADTDFNSEPGSHDRDEFLANTRPARESLRDHLLWQMNLMPLSERDRLIALSLVDAIDPRGFLASPMSDIHEGLQTELDSLEADEIEAVLHQIQNLDPPGIGARDLRECLLIQLRQLPESTRWRSQAIGVVADHLALISNQDLRGLTRVTGLEETELAGVMHLLRSLTPAPGDALADDDVEYIIPDVFVRKESQRWRVELNPDIAPRIRINTQYAALIRRADNSDDNTYLRNNLQEARWFLKSLRSRNETLLRVASCIVEHQQGFLEHGDEAMKPMVLADISTQLELHESTVSRATTRKYMHTPRGIFELKYFFSSHVSTSEGGECSATAIRAIIRKLVGEENPRKPLSDSRITDLLEKQGIQVARRTVAKYRESLSIPSSSDRKRLV